MIKHIIVFSFIVSFLSTNAQSNDVESALYNIGFGSVLSTVGAVINKKSNQSLSEVIKKSLWQGALGGYITFESKRILRLASKDYDWKLFWFSKFVNSFGTSIKENSALNKDFWEQLNVNIGFSRFEIYPKNNFKIK